MEGKIFEYNGDYFHGNPKVFPPEEMNKTLGKTFGELYRKTIEKENLIKSAGYTLVSIWENDFDPGD